MKRGLDKFYDQVKKEGYSGVPVNWIRESGEPSLNSKYVNRLIEYGKIFSRLSWAQGTSGNLSFRDGNVIGVTASKTELGKLVEDEIVEVSDIHYKDVNPTVIY